MPTVGATDKLKILKYFIDEEVLETIIDPMLGADDLTFVALVDAAEIAV